MARVECATQGSKGHVHTPWNILQTGPAVSTLCAVYERFVPRITLRLVQFGLLSSAKVCLTLCPS
jgi:hypothetical protein